MHQIFCERPPALANGHLDVSVPSLARHPYNATVRYRCSAGYIMQGEPGLRTCAVNGRWSGRMPHCQPLVCPMPPKYPHARYELLNGTTRWQAMVEYSCEEGFVLSADSGPVLTQCQELASWQPVPVNITCEPAPPPVAPDPGQDGAGTGRGLTVTSEQHEPMSSGVVAGIGVVAVIAIAAMIIVGIFCTRKRVWKRRKRSGPPGTGPVLPPADVKTYDQVYEPSYQNVLESAPPALLSFRAAGSPRPSSLEPERPRGRPIEPPYETLKARLAADAAPPDDAYEPIAGGRLYDDVAPEPNPYQSLPPAAGEPDYETLAVSRSAVRAPDEGDYDLVPARGYRDYDQVPAASYEDCRFAAGEGAVPDLLKGASAGGEPDIPPEILALYAKVNKSKKRNRDDQGEGEPTDPPSPSSSAASYTRNLIEKFNRLAGTDAEPEAAPRPPPGDDKVQYTQVCAGERGGEVRRPAAEPVVYSAVRPLPPVPPEP
ncbi:uncharacterized protein LOC119111212 [Pollicipes pollicipes]|uniref:uncharacterized protein LOC119111212 n=1 Tax=Pollicipes pollicipes TaxID=41117 RepID=UPI001884DA3D|nr:uncharacterized protein LOC119111212 [Pollicipes pollicipes]